MAFDRIRKVDLVGIGVIGLADTPALSTAEMQKKFEETAREVLMPAHNALVDKLNAEGAAHIGAVTPDGLTTTVQGALEALNQAIDDKVQELGAGDMAKAVYDPKGAGVDVTVQTYTHTKSDNVHEFVGTGANGRVLMTDDVAEGDTVTVNGWEVDAYVGADNFDSALAGQSLAGRWLTFVFDGVQINFKGGGGAVTVEGLAAENIVAGQTVTVRQGTKVVESVTGTAVVSTGASWSTRVPGNYDLIGPTKQNDGNYIYPCMTVFGDTVADGDFYATLPAGVYCVAGFGLGLDTGKYHIAKKGALSAPLCTCDYSYGSVTNVFTGRQSFTLSEQTTVTYVSAGGYSEGACVMVTRVDNGE